MLIWAREENYFSYDNNWLFFYSTSPAPLLLFLILLYVSCPGMWAFRSARRQISFNKFQAHLIHKKEQLIRSGLDFLREDERKEIEWKIFRLQSYWAKWIKRSRLAVTLSPIQLVLAKLLPRWEINQLKWNLIAERFLELDEAHKFV